MDRNADAPAGTRARREGMEDHSYATAARRPRATNCACQACADLLTECGEALFPIYSKKLLQKGWAGQMSPAERAYYRRHRSEAQQAAARAAGARMKTMREGAQTSSTDGEAGAGGDSVTLGDVAALTPCDRGAA